jgi:predicted secreted protein
MFTLEEAMQITDWPLAEAAEDARRDYLDRAYDTGYEMKPPAHPECANYMAAYNNGYEIAQQESDDWEEYYLSLESQGQ